MLRSLLALPCSTISTTMLVQLQVHSTRTTVARTIRTNVAKGPKANCISTEVGLLIKPCSFFLVCFVFHFYNCFIRTCLVDIPGPSVTFVTLSSLRRRNTKKSASGRKRLSHGGETDFECSQGLRLVTKKRLSLKVAKKKVHTTERIKRARCRGTCRSSLFFFFLFLSGEREDCLRPQ